MTNEQKQQVKQNIMEAGLALILSQGFNNTGLSQLLKAANVPKGSFYYYFRSKDDFGLQLIDHYREHTFAELEAALAQNDKPALERFRGYFEAGKARFVANDFQHGCFFGTMAQEMASQHPEFREALQQVFAEWKSRLAQFLRQAQAEGMLATDAPVETLIEGWMMLGEGALMRARVTRSVEPLDLALALFMDGWLKHPALAHLPKPKAIATLDQQEALAASQS